MASYVSSSMWNKVSDSASGLASATMEPQQSVPVGA
jgi:hypothetical protein